MKKLFLIGLISTTLVIPSPTRAAPGQQVFTAPYTGYGSNGRGAADPATGDVASWATAHMTGSIRGEAWQTTDQNMYQVYVHKGQTRDVTITAEVTITKASSSLGSDPGDSGSADGRVGVTLYNGLPDGGVGGYCCRGGWVEGASWMIVDASNGTSVPPEVVGQEMTFSISVPSLSRGSYTIAVDAYSNAYVWRDMLNTTPGTGEPGTSHTEVAYRLNSLTVSSP